MSTKKVEENSYTDSGFHSGFQESSEISRELTPADKVVDMSKSVGNSHDNDNFTDSGFISESSRQVVAKYMPEYLSDSFRRPIHNPKLDQLFEQDEDGFTKLHVAVMKNLPQAINALTKLVPNADYLNIRNYYGQTSLHLAVLEDQHDSVRMLINAGADLNIRDNRCNTPLQLAVANGNIKCAQIILAAVTKDKKLLANLELWNYDGETCFFLACRNRNLLLMRLLAENGADVNAREGRSGYTPLHYAVESKAKEVTEFLCKECKSLNIDTENYAGLTSFQLSLLTCQEEVANYLVKKGATPYFTSEDSDMDDTDESDYSSDHENQIISKIAGIAVN